MGPLYCIPIPAGIGLTAISGGLRAGENVAKALHRRLARWLSSRPSIGGNRDATPGCGRRYTCIGQSVSSDRERLGARGVATMNLCKCADLDRANVKPEFAHDLVPDAR